MKSVDVPAGGNTSDVASLDNATLTTLTSRIARWPWTIEENALRATVIKTTPSYDPVMCCPIAALALDAAPKRLRQILDDPEHANAAADINAMQTIECLRTHLEYLHHEFNQPAPDEDRILRLATAVAIHDEPETDFAAAVTGLELSAIQKIVKASDDVKTPDGVKLAKELARATGDEQLAVQIQ